MLRRVVPTTLPLRDGQPAAADRPDITAQVCTFDAMGKPTQARVEGEIPYLVNEFWTAGQRQAHALHEVSYRACFKPQLPAFFIDRLTMPGERVYDPFMGRGTTLIEAALKGRAVAGNDVNPLSTLLARPRLRCVAMAEVMHALAAVDWASATIERPDLLAFYSENTLRQICALRAHLLRHAPLEHNPPAALDWLRMVAINRLTGHSPGFFSVYTLPPNQAVSVASQLKINQKRAQTPQDKDVAAIILKKSRALTGDGLPAQADAIFATAPAEKTPAIPDASVSLVVTSPPFLDIVNYAADNWLRCWFAGIDPAHVAIAHHRSEAGWQGMVRNVLIELARVVRPGGHVAFEVGEVRTRKVLLERLVWEAAEGLPFERLFVMINAQNFTKTANCWGVGNNAGGTNTNRIVVLRRL
jgi:DNA methylase